MSDRYAVVGNPVAHSRSPLIHRLFAEQTAQDIEYRRMLVPRDGFALAARAFFDGGGMGLNVTLPFKEEACRFATERSARAARAGAVNTLARGSGGAVFGDNTDGVGLVRDLRANLGWEIAGARVLLLGAGGAARGALGPLLAERPATLLIANRTAARARELAAVFADDGRVQGGGLDAIRGCFDLVINASSGGLSGELPVLPPELLAPGARCYDMLYGAAPTAFEHWASQAGAAALSNGLGMLVEQAAESFQLWRGLRPDTAPVIAQLRRGYHIREAAGAADMREAARLFREYQDWLRADLCFQGFERELAELPGRYAPPGGTLLLAESGGQAFACVAMRALDGKCCEMKRLYVPESWRGAGLGRALATRVIEAARRAGYATMRLDTLRRLTEANALYASLGFHECPAYYENPLQDVVFWELDLRGTAALPRSTP
jgi:shikimate dehydrogenase